jgi:hypothetical protein
VHVPRLERWAEKPPVKKSPSLGGYRAVAMNAGLRVSMMKLPRQLRKILTWDRGRSSAGMPSSRSILPRECSSAALTRPSSDPRTRTRVVCYASTSPKAPTSRDGPLGQTLCHTQAPNFGPIVDSYHPSNLSWMVYFSKSVLGPVFNER